MEIKNVLVIGMGTMGSQIGIVCARAGFKTAMLDASADLVEKGLDNIRSFFDKQVKKGKMTQEGMESILSNVHATTDFDGALSKADQLMPSVPVRPYWPAILPH
ncbi:MAG: hypothetical protein JRJ21_03630 [Deltaproteobacteria bacterium]|nr:hypothetical protein [Deltaproteobacteria bacterium]